MAWTCYLIAIIEKSHTPLYDLLVSARLHTDELWKVADIGLEISLILILPI